MKDEKYQTRKQRSIEMLKSGVEPIKDGFNEYYIPSQSQKDKKYRVTITKGWYDCECPDNKQGNLCKHILLLKTYLAIKLKGKEVKKSIEVRHNCPYCESHEIVKDGTRKTTMGKKQRWLCNTCDKRFVATPIKKSKANADVIALVMDLYFKGLSLRDIKDTLEQFQGLKIHHETIRRWINKYMQKITEYTERHTPKVSGVWHSDEQQVKLKKEGAWAWNWNVMDSETRFLLANQVTKSREIKDARRVFQEAKKTANGTAQKVVTDGLQSYKKAVKKEFWTHKNRNPHVRVKSIRHDANNNLIERYHGTYRERDKVMRAFQNKDTVKQYNDNFKTYYNFVRKHQGLNGLTPAQASGIDEEANLKKLLIKSVS